MNKYNKDIVEKWKRGEVALEVDYNKLDEINTFFKELNPRNLTITNKYFKYLVRMSATENIFWHHQNETKLPIITMKDLIMKEQEIEFKNQNFDGLAAGPGNQ